jgi:mono/diheme cytochrome c family protein
VLLAGLLATLVASRSPAGDGKRRLARDNALWALAGLAVAAPSYLAYLRTIPPALLEEAHARMPWVVLWLERLPLLAAATAVAVVLFGWLPGRRLRPLLALVPVALGFALLGAFEFLRESIRKPWIVTGAMYGNSVEPGDLAGSRADGVLAHVAYRDGDEGRDVFLRACRSCHTLDGYKGLAPLLAGTDPAYIAGALRGLDRMRGNMPPFPGDEREIELLAAWLGERVDRRPIAEIHGLRGAALGAAAYDLRCGRCHVPGGWQDVLPTFEGLDAAGIAEFLDTAADIAAEMPPYTGDETERAALAAHIALLANGGAS